MSSGLTRNKRFSPPSAGGRDGGDSVPDDWHGPYTAHQYQVMDADFVLAVRLAIERRQESLQAAAATFDV